MRLTLLTAGVFLVVGAGLVALTYVLVVATVPAETPIQALRSQEVLECEQQQQAATENQHASNPPQPNGAVNVPVPPAQFCRDVMRQASQIGVTSERSSTLHDLLVYSSLGLVVMTGVAAAAAWILSGRALRPLRDVTEAAARASRATLRERLDVPPQSGELKELTNTFNDMLDRLDATFAAQERFVADASHELRTPLTALGAVVDVAMAKDDPTSEQLVRMSSDIRALLEESDALIAALLVLSRSDAGVALSERMDLAELLGDALEARASGLTVERHLVAAPLDADRILLRRAVANLVDNAVIHNDERQWIRASTTSSGSEASLTIESTGPAIAQGEADELFRPFYRAQARTGNGHGLGMAIVRSVAKAHGGRCVAMSRTEGGLTVTMTFPAPVASGHG